MTGCRLGQRCSIAACHRDGAKRRAEQADTQSIQRLHARSPAESPSQVQGMQPTTLTSSDHCYGAAVGNQQGFGERDVDVLRDSCERVEAHMDRLASRQGLAPVDA